MSSPSATDATDADRVIYGKAGSLSYAGITHPGLVRRRNEDTFWVDEAHAMFIVADGMGGQRRGAEAARTAVATIGRLMGQPTSGVAALLPETLRLRWRARAAFSAANDAVRSAAKGGGTTVDALFVRGRGAHVAHVGDSRVYLLRAGSLQKLTRDHTVASERKPRTSADGDDASAQDDGHLLTRVLGSSPAESRPDYLHLDVRPGDTFLLCSDGLCGLVPDGRTAELLGTHWGDPLAASRALVAAALQAGGADNVTVVVVVAA